MNKSIQKELEKKSFEQTDYDIHLQAGLIYVGKNSKGQKEYLGTDKMWIEYQKLINLEISK